MILESAMQIGLRKMAGVASLCEQAQIGQPQPSRQAGFPDQSLLAPGAQPRGIGKRHQEQSAGQAKKGQRTVGPSGHLRMAGSESFCRRFRLLRFFIAHE